MKLCLAYDYGAQVWRCHSKSTARETLGYLIGENKQTQTTKLQINEMDIFIILGFHLLFGI